MFRSPIDASSSDSESGSESDEEVEISRISTNKPATKGSGTDTRRSPGPSVPSHNAGLITASLLEFHYSVRAAEILNVANHGTGIRYDRQSPEAKALAKKMFANGSQLLASHGMLAEDLHTEELEGARRQYLSGIDSLGIQALRDTSLLATSTPKGALEAARAILNPMSSLQLYTARPGVNRYTAEFTEIRQLGKGGFGTVYHVINYVDSQHYAIKKIGLDPRRLKKRWQDGGQEEIENVLREIRTLASLEHSNIVRYFGAWVEGPMGSQYGLTELEGSRPPILRRLLAEKSTETTSVKTTDPYSHSNTKISWGASQDITQSENAEFVSNSDGIIFGEDSASKHSLKLIEGEATTSTVSLSNETDIFTDGDGRGHSSPDHNPNQITLCLQMSLHQLNLASYLSPEPPSTAPSLDPLHKSAHIRHCFHLKPSLSIFLGILSGVQYLHSAGIVHRDLKPANIFLSEDPILRPGFVDASCLACPQQYSRYLNARIGDFGLVGNTTEELSAAACASDKVVGTELYRPPRTQIPTSSSSDGGDANGKDLANSVYTASMVNEKIDVFALGVLLFELLWRFDTKTERFVVLNALTRSGTLPVNFGGIIEHANSDSTAHVWSEGSEGDLGPAGVDTANREQRQQTYELGDMIARCIAGMVQSNPTDRWDCTRVKECIERLLQMCECSVQTVV
jgi:eukaryotic translation initiation factor 2-alpha kinase 3